VTGAEGLAAMCFMMTGPLLDRSAAGRSRSMLFFSSRLASMSAAVKTAEQQKQSVWLGHEVANLGWLGGVSRSHKCQCSKESDMLLLWTPC
jgi:hypothetical protein